jgi:rhodanese-related sulfurtransferase
VLDVRREPEWEAGHIAGASWWPLDNFKVSPPEIDRNATIAVHCKGGYRSMIACSLLQRAGFQNVVNVVGGFDAWQEAKLPVVTEKPVVA